MSAHRVTGKFEEAVSCARSPRGMLHRLKLHHAAHKIGFPNAAGLGTLMNVLAGLVELAGVTAETVGKNKWGVENEIEVAELIDGLRSARQRDEPRRPAGI